MTLEKLLTLLLAIPRDCRDLPVFIDGGSGQTHLTVIEVFPRQNADGVEPHVVVSSWLEGFRAAGALLLEHRRLPGTD